MRGVAKFSKDRKYRYLLARRWGKVYPGTGWLTYVMLNPSTADAKVNDPTIRRCIYFARIRGYGGILVVNLYGIRATDSSTVKLFDDPVGPANDYWIRWAYDRGEETIVAWGNSVRKVSSAQQRISDVLALVDYPYQSHLWCFGRTKSGQPKHPLMLPNNRPLEDY